MSLRLLALFVTLAALPAGAEEGADEAPAYLTGRSRSAREVEPGCVLRNLQLPEGVARPCAITVKLAVSRSGTASRISIPGGGQPAPVEEALVQAVKSCAWIPGELEGKLAATWLFLPLRLEAPCEEAPPASAGFPLRGWSPAVEETTGCVARSVRTPRFQGRVLASFVVRADGSVADFSMSGGPEAVATAVETAVRSCSWTPGRNGEGKPVAIRTILPISFGTTGLAATLATKAPGNPPLSRDPREASPGCVRHHLQSMEVKGYGDMAVRFVVTPEGVAEQFSFAPDDLPAHTRLKLIDAFSTCAWEPGLGLEGKPVVAWIVVPLETKL